MRNRLVSLWAAATLYACGGNSSPENCNATTCKGDRVCNEQGECVFPESEPASTSSPEPAALEDIVVQPDVVPSEPSPVVEPDAFYDAPGNVSDTGTSDVRYDDIWGINDAGVTVPTSWLCEVDYFGSGDGCDCNCGTYDPDCKNTDDVYNCEKGQTCSSEGLCEGEPILSDSIGPSGDEWGDGSEPEPTPGDASADGLGTCNDGDTSGVLCNSGKCIPDYFTCDGEPDCPGGEDEENCCFDKLVGGQGYQIANAVAVVDDGYIIAGENDSSDNPAWVAKFSGNFYQKWGYFFSFEKVTSIACEKTFCAVVGNTFPNNAHLVLFSDTSDGAKILGEETFTGSSRFLYSIKDIPWSSKGFIAAGRHGADGWVIKFQAPNLGDIIVWEETYSHGFNEVDVEQFRSITPTSDEGYVAVGLTQAGPGNDAWIVKIDKNGALLWKKKVGGDDYDIGVSVAQLTNGDYLVAGASESWSLESELYRIRLNSSGTVLWDNATPPSTINGWGTLTDNTAVTAVRATANGGYMITANLKSDVSASDSWIFKYDADDDSLLGKSLGVVGKYDQLQSIEPLASGGFIAVGGASSSNPNYSYDARLLRVNSDGDLYCK